MECILRERLCCVTRLQLQICSCKILFRGIRAAKQVSFLRIFNVESLLPPGTKSYCNLQKGGFPRFPFMCELACTRWQGNGNILFNVKVNDKLNDSIRCEFDFECDCVIGNVTLVANILNSCF